MIGAKIDIKKCLRPGGGSAYKPPPAAAVTEDKRHRTAGTRKIIPWLDADDDLVLQKADSDQKVLDWLIFADYTVFINQTRRR